MTKFCIHHNAVCYNGKDWHYLKECVGDILKRRGKPAVIVACPHCQEKVKRIEAFLNRHWRV